MDKTLMGRGDALFDQQILQLMNILSEDTKTSEQRTEIDTIVSNQ